MWIGRRRPEKRTENREAAVRPNIPSITNVGKLAQISLSFKLRIVVRFYGRVSCPKPKAIGPRTSILSNESSPIPYCLSMRGKWTASR